MEKESDYWQKKILTYLIWGRYFLLNNKNVSTESFGILYESSFNLVLIQSCALFQVQRLHLSPLFAR
jgi:hypothetical protein